MVDVVSLDFELKTTYQFFRTVNICDRKEEESKEGRRVGGREGKRVRVNCLEYLQYMG